MFSRPQPVGGVLAHQSFWRHLCHRTKVATKELEISQSRANRTALLLFIQHTGEYVSRFCVDPVYCRSLSFSIFFNCEIPTTAMIRTSPRANAARVRPKNA